MKVYSLTTEELTRSANKAVLSMAQKLYSSGAIDEETYRIMTEDFAIVVAEKDFFGKVVAKALGRDAKHDDMVYYTCVQVNNINYNKDKKDVHQPEDSDTRRVDHGSI